MSTPDVLPTADLIILGLKPGALPPQTASFYVANARTVERQLIHNDGFNTLYVRLTFPTGSLAALSGQPVGSEDSVLVTVQPRSGAYGMTLSPATLTFAAGAGRPTAEFSFARYGDPEDAVGARYPNVGAFVNALSLWLEISPDRWARIANATASGLDAVAARLEEGGRFVVAAPR